MSIVDDRTNVTLEQNMILQYLFQKPHPTPSASQISLPKLQLHREKPELDSCDCTKCSGFRCFNSQKVSERVPATENAVSGEYFVKDT